MRVVGDVLGRLRGEFLRMLAADRRHGFVRRFVRLVALFEDGASKCCKELPRRRRQGAGRALRRELRLWGGVC